MRTNLRPLRYGMFHGLLLAAGLFAFHTAVLFELAYHAAPAAELVRKLAGHHVAGIGVVLVSFLCLFIAHYLEAAAWGFFLWRKGLLPGFGEAVYFSASSITALGYGDVVLPKPQRLLGPIVAINGLLMFGCSTAYLFLVIQSIWLKIE